MIRLCGFPVSNYYNKVKLALLEKGLAFEEEYVGLSRDSPRLAASAARKIPFLEDAGQVIVESQVIVDYLEDAYPRPALYPVEPLARAHCRELIAVMELYVELPARRLYPQAFFGAPANPELCAEVGRDLERGVRALRALCRFAPFIAGPELSLADCAASVHLPLVSMATRRTLGADVLAGLQPLQAYQRRLLERPAFARVHADRKVGEQAMAARRGVPPPQA